jgi:DinB family protein
VENTLTSIRAILAGTPSRWRNLIENLPDTLIRRFPAPGEWSALDCLRHLRDGDRDNFSVRTGVFLTGGTIVPINPTGAIAGDDTSPLQVVNDFARLRTECLAILEGLATDDLTRTAEHGEYGTVQLGQMLNQWAAHDLAHTIQAERALAQPFIAASGPWRWSFGDLDVANDRGV